MNCLYVESLTDWEDFKTTLGLMCEEWDEIDLKIKIVGETINVRQNQEMTQQALEKLSNIRQQ